MSHFQHELSAKTYELDSEIDIVDPTAPHDIGRIRRSSVRTFSAQDFINQTPFKFFSDMVASHVASFMQWISFDDKDNLIDLVEHLKTIYIEYAFQKTSLTEDQVKDSFPNLSNSDDIAIVINHLKKIQHDVAKALLESDNLFYEYENPTGKKKDKERIRNRASSGLGLSRSTLHHVATLSISWKDWAQKNLFLPLIIPHLEVSLNTHLAKGQKKIF